MAKTSLSARKFVSCQAGSSHADADEILAWMRKLRHPPRQTFITHGEPGTSDALRQRLERELGWATLVPEFRQTVELLSLG